MEIHFYFGKLPSCPKKIILSASEWIASSSIFPILFCYTSPYIRISATGRTPKAKQDKRFPVGSDSIVSDIRRVPPSLSNMGDERRRRRRRRRRKRRSTFASAFGRHLLESHGKKRKKHSQDLGRVARHGRLFSTAPFFIVSKQEHLSRAFTQIF